MTDSKRTIQLAPAAAAGSVKSLRYQPTAPLKLATLLSPTFQAYGTPTMLQPAVEGLVAKPLPNPLPLSKRNSHGPSMMKRPLCPSLYCTLVEGTVTA